MMSIDSEFRDAFRYWRQRGKTAADAHALARADCMATPAKRRYPATPGGGRSGAGFGPDKLQWTESPADLGLRFVGFADELAPRLVDHNGWFSDAYQEETYRGAVWQLPARGGRAVYLAGYREGSSRRGSGRRGGDWQDTAYGRDQGCGAIQFGVLHYGEKGGAGDYDRESDARDAARDADSIAESYAESSREYSEAWQAGAKYAESGDELSEARRDALALIRETKAACSILSGLGESITGAIRREIESAVEAVADLRSKRAAMLSEYKAWQGSAWNAVQWEAFADGAGLKA